MTGGGQRNLSRGHRSGDYRIGRLWNPVVLVLNSNSAVREAYDLGQVKSLP